MRVLEMLWVAACVAMLMILLSRNTINRKAGVIVGIAGGSLFAVQLLVEGYRWQMIPAYIVTALLFMLVLFRRRTVKKPLRYMIWGLSAVLLGVSVALSALLPVFHLPKPSGEFRVGTDTFHFVDADREETFTEQTSDKRELIVQVWYPAAESDQGAEKATVFPKDKRLFHTYMQAYSEYLGLPAAALDYWKYSRANAYGHADLRLSENPYPVVLLSHGMGVGRILHSSQAEHLASHGYIVFAIDHTYSTAATAFPDGRVTGFLTEQSQERLFEDSRAILKVWNEDISFVTNQLEKLQSGAIASKFKGALDLDNIGMMGHSFGGAAAFEAVYSNPRIKAGVNMDGTLFVTKDRDDMEKPFMFMESEDFMKVNEQQAKYRQTPATEAELQALGLTREQFGMILANRELELKLMDRLIQQGLGRTLYIEGAGHYNFTDLQLYSPLTRLTGMTGSMNGSRGAEIVNAYVLEFFNQHLRGMEESKLLTGPSEEYPEVKYPDRVSRPR
ncbi:alpha/beta hydrolase family protein [Paenibacillus sp. HGF5]|uniref:alpha/beta hydrolase family protein n=1 Tax=Paenibacillus sp. HGF5 TaxID=908341 RepID=UPI0002072CF0|nr:dienelactone hydrolase family protein [Paenibacillus sp. HGF5]EGG37032.1 Platelet-activating factor acetylhydrolase, plasma/intracellular isoform II [Paenibacillus sp. HGF5]